MPPHLRRLLITTGLLYLISMNLGAQKQNIRVVVKDSATKKPLSQATVVVMSRKDFVFIEFGVTDSLGKYLFRNINLNQAGYVTASASGYGDVQFVLQKPSLNDKGRLTDTAIELLVPPKFVVLEDVLVAGRANPIKMNKDTLEFNADFFKTQTNAVLEDLLRKLPGVELRNGSEVYVNGQRVNRILVDGKEFFSSDPLIILKNLPADIIAKVQVVDEKNTIAKETRELEDIPKTINLKLKRHVKQGAFGKFYAGYGTDNRYETGGILNTFRDTLQVSFIGSSNNHGRGNNYLQNSGGQFGGGGSYGSGIQTANSAGVNLSYDMQKGKQLSVQYSYGQNSRRTGSQNQSQQFLGDSVLYNNSNNESKSNDNSHKVSASLRWKQDSTGYLRVQVSTDWSNSSGLSISDTKLYSVSVPLLSQSFTNGRNSSKRNNIIANADYSKSFVKLKLDWSINGTYNTNDIQQQSATNSRYIRIVNNFIPDSVIQQRDNSTPAWQLTINNSFNKNWKKKNTFIWKTEFASSKDIIGGDTYQYSDNTKKIELIPSLSIKLTQEKQRLNNQFSYRYSSKGFSIQPGIYIRSLKIQNAYNFDSIPDLNRTYNLIAPSFYTYYKGLSFSYSRMLREPSANSLRPIVDSSNPLYVTSGNPNLRPSKTDNYSLNYYKYFNRSKININAWASINKQIDAVGTSRQVFPDGKTVLSYLNLDNIINYNSSFGISKSYYKNNWNYNLSLNGNIYITESPVILNSKVVNTVSTNPSTSLSGYVDYDGKYRWQTTYNVNVSRTKSDDASIKTASTSQHSFNNVLYAKVLKKLWWNANFNYNINPGTPAGFKKQWLFCDMSFTYNFLKRDRGQMKLSGFDIFNQNQGIYRNAYQNFISINQSLVQKRFFMLTMIYTLQKI